jgi:hypothetical protein
MRPSTLPSAEIWRIPAESRGVLPISQTTGPNGEVLVVSTYESVVWDFSPYIRTVNLKAYELRIDFSWAVPSGSRLSDPEHSDLLASVKEFIYVRWMFPAVKSGKYLKARTVIGEWYALRRLLDWMIQNGVRQFREITPQVAKSFIGSIIERRDRNGYAKKSGIKPASLIETLYQSRSFLTDAPRNHPWPDSGVEIELGFRAADRHRGVATTEIIPRRLLIKLGSFAQRLLTEQAPRILEAWQAVWSEANRVIDDMKREEILEQDLRWGRVKHKTVSKKESILHKQFADRMPPIIRSHGYEDADAFLADVAILASACYALCGIFSGMRDSELSALRHGCFRRTVEPDGEEYCWLEGLSFKTEEDPRPGKWMVPPVVEQAVHCAEAITTPLIQRNFLLQDMLRAEYATVDDVAERIKIGLKIEDHRKLDNCLFLRTHSLKLVPAAPTNNSTNFWLKELATAAGLTLELDDMGEVRDRVKLYPGVTWPLATHQFRRTFAVFVARNLLGDARYLRHHFKHWSIDMTLHYAHDPTLDDTVFESINSMRDELQAELISGWIVGDQCVSGGRAKQVIQFRDRNSVKTVKDARDLARSLGDGIYVRGTGHSWCLAENEGCGGEGLYDAIRCVGCGESLIDESHIPVWKAIRDQQVELMQSPDLGVPGKTRAQKHLDAANTILRELGPAGGN